jgi:hypothetical protein
MPKVPTDLDRLDIIRQACSTLEELQLETRSLYDSIPPALPPKRVPFTARTRKSASRSRKMTRKANRKATG